MAAAAATADARSVADMSLEQLANLEVTSVSKAPQSLIGAPASIFVITHDDIVHAGVTSIGEALRMAPNLRIAQYTSTNYVAAARGFGGSPENQNFSNKLLILIDGRSVYSPLYSGVYLDVQDLLLEDVDRIEVISGPGATLWGANAMNGVINIITRPAYQTERTFVKLGAGDREQAVSGRIAGKLKPSLAYRIYAKGFKRQAESVPGKTSAFDAWDMGQGGYRMDWSEADDTLTAQGDVYRGNEGNSGLPDLIVQGANELLRWQRRTGNGQWQLQGYYDFTSRTQPLNAGFALHTYDLEGQQTLNLERHRLVGGAGLRLHRYHITDGTGLQFDPTSRSLFFANVFAQDTYTLSDSIDLTLGLKFERDPYSGWTPLPDLRFSWKASNHTVIWGSAAKAIRAPTPFDADVVEKVAGTTLLHGNMNFSPEQVYAFEMGYRSEATQYLSYSISVFYNLYDKLRTIETDPSTGFFPLTWGNLMDGHTYGAELWGTWEAAHWWRISPGLSLLREGLGFKPGASRVQGVIQAGNDPRSNALLRSSMDLSARTTFDVGLRYVGALPEPHLGQYCELNASLDWRFVRDADISLSGSNLLHDRHLEYPAPTGEFIRRSALAQLRWRF